MFAKVPPPSNGRIDNKRKKKENTVATLFVAHNKNRRGIENETQKRVTKTRVQHDPRQDVPFRDVFLKLVHTTTNKRWEIARIQSIQMDWSPLQSDKVLLQRDRLIVCGIARRRARACVLVLLCISIRLPFLDLLFASLLSALNKTPAHARRLNK